MFLDQSGEIIADIMTLNRSYAQIPSASAILDASNFTFHAITYGKDSDGFRNHAHVILSPSADGVVKAISYGDSSFSGYQVSTTASALSFNYKLKPQSPTPMDVRLEKDTTLPNYTSAVADLGHCLNSIIDSNLSSFGHLIGCFPASGGTDFKVFDQSNSLIFSGSLSSFYNYNLLMDPSGFLTFANVAPSDHQSYYDSDTYTYGALRSPVSASQGQVKLKWLLTSGDAGALLLFGGVYHIGLWCLDIKEMLKDGYYPPYSFNALNNIRKYKLFAKKTFNKDLLQMTGNSSFIDLFQNGNYDNSMGTVIKWTIRFL